jgi:hypothetical protein
MVIMRDSMLAVESESVRLQRATSTAVATATARRLATRCAAAGRTADVTRAKVQPLETSADFGNQVLQAYRAALLGLATSMRACDKELAAGTPSAVRREAIVDQATASSQRYEFASDALLRALEIPLRPKGMPGGG